MRNRLPYLILIIFALNLIWEFFHYRLYVDLTGIPSTIHLIGAAFVDIFLVSTIFLIVSLKDKNLKWMKFPSKKDYFMVAVVGITLAFIWELTNISLGRWEYKEIMPTIFGVGLSPLVQLAFTSILSLIIFNRFSQRLNS
ncbi:MAG: hypothetical protein V1788_02935 [Nanoarchaeota archaeon]|nr:hypothetical protein [Nanoarchaeota archaeon]